MLDSIRQKFKKLTEEGDRMLDKLLSEDEANTFRQKLKELTDAPNIDILKRLLLQDDTKYFGGTKEELVERIEEVSPAKPDDEPDDISCWFLRDWARDNVIIFEHKGDKVTIGFMGMTADKIKICAYINDDPRYWVCAPEYHHAENVRNVANMLETAYGNGYLSTTVNFPTGELVFGNFFYPLDELDKDIKYQREYSINSMSGVIKNMEWLAENKGIAYGQLGNTYCSVYKVSDDRIVISSACLEDGEWLYNEETDEYGDVDALIEGWEKLGNICCDVWRFEAVDKARFKEHDFDFEAFKEERSHKEFSETKVPAGDWEVRVFYDVMSEEEIIEKYGFPLYAELVRK